MLKKSILKQLSLAKKAHLLWIERANTLIYSTSLNKDFIPFDSTECGLGVWINQEGKKLRHIKRIDELIKDIENHHDELHNIYLNIYQIFFILPKQRSFFHKLFNFGSEIENQEVKDAAKLHLEDIKKSANTLIHLLNQLEKEIEKLTFHQLNRTLKPTRLAQAI